MIRTIELDTNGEVFRFLAALDAAAAQLIAVTQHVQGSFGSESNWLVVYECRHDVALPVKPPKVRNSN